MASPAWGITSTFYPIQVRSLRFFVADAEPERREGGDKGKREQEGEREASGGGRRERQASRELYPWPLWAWGRTPWVG